MSQDTTKKAKDKMFTVASMPVFYGDRSWEFRPSIPSPLASSPIRASSPLSPIDKNTLPHRQTQSSPIPAPKFKFASRPARPNPVVRRREDAQESRRRLFLQNVRNRADDRSYQRRDMEGTLLRSSWETEMRERLLAKQLEGDAIISETDIDDAAMLAQQQAEEPSQDIDEMMVDIIAQQEENELDALLLSYSQSQESNDETRPGSPSLSDDEDYDALFMNLLSQQSSQEPVYSQEMDTC